MVMPIYLMRGVGVKKNNLGMGIGVIITITLLGCTQESALYQNKTDFIGPEHECHGMT